MVLSEELHERILEKLDLSKEVEDEVLVEIIHHVLEEKGRETHLSLKEKSEKI